VRETKRFLLQVLGIVELKFLPHVCLTAGQRFKQTKELSFFLFCHKMRDLIHPFLGKPLISHLSWFSNSEVEISLPLSWHSNIHCPVTIILKQNSRAQL
jgi:hypothetical protein